METLGSRIRAAREAAGLSQEAVARVFGIRRNSVSLWESNTTRPDQDKVALLAETLGVTLDWLVTGSGAGPTGAKPSAPQRPAPNATIGAAVPQSKRRLQVLGIAAGGDDGRFVLNGEVADHIDMPPSLEAVRDAYAVYVHGESMVPRYEPGEAVYVNPHRPPRAGDYVVAQIQDTPHGEVSAYVKRFVSRSATELVLEQLNPPPGQDRLMRFPASTVLKVHRVLRSGE